MGILINISNFFSSSIWGGILILLPEVVLAIFALYIVKDERMRLKVFAALTAVLLLIYGCVLGIHFLLTRNLLEHNNADYKNGTRWDVSIYDNKSLSGDPVFSGDIYGLSNGLQVDWGYGPPRKNLSQTDNFSATFSTSADFDSGLYCFVMLVDDGANLIVGNTTLISHYHGYTPAAVFKEPIQLDTGNYPILIQYYDETNTANFHIFWYKLTGDECQSINEP